MWKTKSHSTHMWLYSFKKLVRPTGVHTIRQSKNFNSRKYVTPNICNKFKKPKTDLADWNKWKITVKNFYKNNALSPVFVEKPFDIRPYIYISL